MSGTKVEDQGPIVDIDFNSENLDADVDVGAVYGESTVVKEYTVDVIAGTYNLDINFKNDVKVEDTDRNFYIEKIECANDGINYESLVISESNTNLELWTNFSPMGWVAIDYETVDSNYNPDEPRTDSFGTGYIAGTDPGSNHKYVYNFVINSIKVWEAGVSTFNITFT